MAKKSTILPPAYFKSLTIENVRCFKDEQKLDLSDGNNKPAQWTVIIGNNGTGKTTLLQCLAGLEPINAENFFSKSNVQITSSFKGKTIPNIAAGGLNLTNLSSKIKIECAIFYGKKLSASSKSSVLNHFGIKSSNISIPENFSKIGNLKVYYYPANRTIKRATLTKDDSEITKANEAVEVLDAEEWLMQLDYAVKKRAENASTSLKRAKKILIDILPDVTDLKFKTTLQDGYTNYVEATTPYGKVPLKDLSYGYLVMIAWVIDLVKRMLERYPNSPKPLEEPAVVLVDEIDMHMHPEWQRHIIDFLSSHFPNTQFIVTAHSPILVQTQEKINIILLQRDNDKIEINSNINKKLLGWSVEEILNDMMGLQKTKSDQYIDLMNEFDAAMQKEDSIKVKKAYKELDAILHPDNEIRKLLRIQMASVVNSN